jgi:hypothetical protein
VELIFHTLAGIGRVERAIGIDKEASLRAAPFEDQNETLLASTELIHYQNAANVFY